MISKLLKQHKPDVYAMALNNKHTKPFLKQLDNIWNKIEKLLTKEIR